MKKLCTLFILLFISSIAAYAYDFEAVNEDGVTIYYNIHPDDNQWVAVSYKSSNHEPNGKYSGKIVIPEQVSYQGNIYTVAEIGTEAFYECDNLTSVVIPGTVISISSNAFNGCTNLTSLTLPNSVKHIGNDAFGWCISLSSVTLGNSLQSIGYAAFENCFGLLSIVIPRSVTYIDSNPFSGCTMQTIVVEEGNTIYDSRENCNAIIETASNRLITGGINTVIPNTVTAIAPKAFYSCSGLSTIAIPNSVATIGEYAFFMSDLQSVEIPDSVITIEMAAFSGCIYMTSAQIGNSVRYIGSEAFSHTGLSSVEIPNSVKTIGDNAFNYCESLESLTISSSVTTIERVAFANCIGLETVTILNEEPSNVMLGEYIFANVPTNECKLYVPKGSKELYAAADVWKMFGTIEELNEIDSVDRVTRDSYKAIYYDLNGCPIARPLRGNIYIKVADDAASKIVY